MTLSFVGVEEGDERGFNLMPPRSEVQRRAMHAAAAGKSTIGIPAKVGREYAKTDKGGKLPARKSRKK